VRSTSRAIVVADQFNVRLGMILAPINRDGTTSEYAGHVSDIGRSAIQSTVPLYSSVGWIIPWIGYLAIEHGMCVGTCAFTSAPKDGVVEIAYFTFPEYERRGVATRMAAALVSLANESAPEIIVTAHTLPEENVSTQVLRKLGFVFAGPKDHEQDGRIWVWRHQVPIHKPNQSKDPTP
jgi:[ribosomal protein S5]-alanine N-acetyltransferase